MLCSSEILRQTESDIGFHPRCSSTDVSPKGMSPDRVVAEGTLRGGLCDFGGKRLGRGSRLCSRVRDHGAKLCYLLGFNINLPYDHRLEPLSFSPCSGEDHLKHMISRRLCRISRP